LPVNLAIISNFGVSVFSIKRMRFNSDGVGCGGEQGAAARPGRRRIATPNPQRCRRHGCAIRQTFHSIRLRPIPSGLS
jgi:hypothetical protein